MSARSQEERDALTHWCPDCPTSAGAECIVWPDEERVGPSAPTPLGGFHGGRLRRARDYGANGVPVRVPATDAATPPALNRSANNPDSVSSPSPEAN